MQLYSGSTTQFVRDSVQNQVAEQLKTAFFEYYRYNPSPGEVQSWRNSLRAMAQVVQYAGLDDNGVAIEYQLPLTSRRIDCLFTGQGQDGNQAVLVELKQWEKAGLAEGEYIVTFVGGGQRDMLHPSVQAYQYREYLRETHTAFHGIEALRLDSCAYLHNYAFDEHDALLDDRYLKFTSEVPVFSLNDVELLTNYLSRRLGEGGGIPLLDRVRQGVYKPSKKLMDQAAGVIKGNPSYRLLDEQLVVYDRIFSSLREGIDSKQKQVVVVKGGPGTGKSVIAINLLADALKKGYVSHYATGSKSFTETLRKVVGKQPSALFHYFNSYGEAAPDALDLLVMDEAHRIRKTSANRFTPAAKRTGTSQIAELLRAARVSVFLIDDHQVVRPNEVGSVEYIRQAAKELGAPLREYQLDIQFRCGGSEAFVNWINNTLGIERTANVLWEGHTDFEFGIVPGPEQLEALIRKRAAEGQSARLVAGFCWEWSMPRSDGTLIDDVVIGDWKRPWDARHEAKKLAPGIPKASLWAHDPNGIDQVGCIYTAQGFEFDYVGVIFGRDLYYDPQVGEWKSRKEESHDSMVKRSKDDFSRLVKNAYRVLLSRGMKGCYVCFLDKDTENFFRSRMDQSH